MQHVDQRIIDNFRPCDECNSCCKGNLLGMAYGNVFGNKRSCIFLVKEKCAIYESRPDSCKNYQCAWSQGLLDIDMRPDKSGLLVSIEKDKSGNQFFSVIEIRKNMPFENYKKIEEAAKKLNTYCVIKK